MSKPTIDPIPGKFADKTLKSLFMKIQNIFNNFSGVWLEEHSIPASKLALLPGDIPMSAIRPEWLIPLALPAEDAQTVSTSYVRCSGIFPWDPTKYPTTGGSWYFAASLAINNAAQTVTAHLMGTAEVTDSVLTHTGDVNMTLKWSTPLTMPTTAQNLYVEFKTSDASYIASFGGARLVFIPS